MDRKCASCGAENLNPLQHEPICAVATPAGSGAVAMIRVSGERSIEIVDSIFQPHRHSDFKRLTDLPGYSVRFGSIYELNSKGEREVIDEVLVTVFRAPMSYTGEDTVEISCHGSLYIQQELIMLLISKGVRAAGPGEFSQRAFLNGKMDLAQAEAVADLIASENYSSHRIAMQQMKGGFSSELRHMREDLLNLVSLMELELDFSEEDVEFADRNKLREMLDKIRTHVSSLTDSFKVGNVIKNGVPATIVGATNTGKSTLLNALLGEERAIVSNIHGTTRDTIEDCVNIGGIKFRFIDTAGIRSTDEVIEMIGIERTYSKIAQASVVILVLDAERPEFFEESISSLLPKLHLSDGTQKLVVLLNKIDKCLEGSTASSHPSASDAGRDSGVDGGPHASVSGTASAFASASGNSGNKAEDENDVKSISALQQFVASGEAPLASHPAILSLLHRIEDILGQNGIEALALIPASAKAGVGIEHLRKVLVNTQKDLNANASSVLVSNVRHYEALRNAAVALERVSYGLEDGTPTDLVAQDIREALFHIGSIVGEINTEEILGNIFGKFCIGK